MLIYELPASSLKCRTQPNVIRRSFEPRDQMLYHRTILEVPHGISDPGWNKLHCVDGSKNRLWFGNYLRIFSASAHSEGIPRGIFPENEKKRSKVRITPVMRRVSRRSELPMAPVQIPQPPVQIPQIPQPPVQIPDGLEPVQIPDVLEPVQIPLVPQSPVQIPVSHVLEPPMQIPHVPEPPVQIPVSQVPQSPVQIPPMQIPLVHIPDVPEHVQIPVSQVPQPPMQILPKSMQILHVSEPVQIPDVTEHVQIQESQVPKPSVQIPSMQIPSVQSLPDPMQILPDLDILDPLESTDAFDQLMSFVFRPQELQLLHTVPSIFDGNLFSFLEEFERAPMDLTMPRLNSCVKKSIGFKPIQPMDLSVNSCL
ncbi:hypothetical protein TNCV_2648231 [Trichonephila clavipes]|nr:hypothetical protein TNCV_2648231 [Trichonephila clavipes]